MAVKAEVKMNEERPEYPYLGISNNGHVVYFTEPGTGLTLATSDRGQVGYTSSTYAELSSFKVFTGSITLSNQ